MAITYFNTVPNNNSTFLSDLRTFLQQEDADRYDELNVSGIIIQNGLITPGAGLTGDPGSLIAYAGGYRITETGTITFTDDTANIWVVAHKDTTGLPATPGNFTRVSGTHYLIDETTGASTPSLPEDCTFLMEVTTASGSITVVNDLRVTGQGTSDIITTQGDIIIGNAAGTPVRLAIGSTGGILLVGSGTLAYLAIGATGQVLRSNGTTLAYVDGLTTKGDLWTYSTVPARLAVGGTDGMLLVVDSSAATGLKWDQGLTTAGDILYRDASGYQRLAIGTAGQAYKVNSGATAGEWGTLPLGGGGTNATSFTASQIIAANVGATALVSTGMTAPAGATGNVVTESNTQTLSNKTLVTPTIASFANAPHDHSDAAGGGVNIPVGGLKKATGSSSGVETPTGFTVNQYAFASPTHVIDTGSGTPAGTYETLAGHDTADARETNSRKWLATNNDINTYTTTWDYLTASENPHIFIEVENISGNILGMWETEDPPDVEFPDEEPFTARSGATLYRVDSQLSKTTMIATCRTWLATKPALESFWTKQRDYQEGLTPEEFVTCLFRRRLVERNRWNEEMASDVRAVFSLSGLTTEQQRWRVQLWMREVGRILCQHRPNTLTCLVRNRFTYNSRSKMLEVK